MRYILIILVFLSVGANAQMVIKAHANYRPYAQPAVNLLLDDYPNAAAAYSLRKLDKDYTGAAIRVRKDTTGQPESDIGFTASGDLDTAALKDFAKTRNCFVVTWYDQSGNGRNCIQNTAANQSRIAGNGVPVRNANGKVVCNFTFQTSWLTSSTTHTFSGDITMFGMYNNPGVPNGGVFSYGEESNARRRSMYIWNEGAGTTYYHYASAFAQNLRLATVTANANVLTYILFNHTSQQITGGVNGATVTTASRTLTNPSASSIHIGRTGSNEYSAGNIFELIMYNSNQSSNRTGIENNINDYYNLYWNGDFTGILDTYGSSAAAYSLRNLSSTYTGPLIRVRKDTTGQPEMDIYGDYYGNLDTVGLKNFLLTRSGFITTWYSQGDSTSVNFTQTTAANQPRIALNGVIDRLNGKPVMLFENVTGGIDFLTVSSSTQKFAFLHQSGLSSVIFVGATGGTSDDRVIIDNHGTSSGNIGYSMYQTPTAKMASAVARGVGGTFVSNNVTANNFIKVDTLGIYYNELDNANGTAANRNKLYYNNGNAITNNTFTNAASSSNASFNIRIGVLSNNATLFPLSGYVTEIIFYKGDKTSSRTGIRDNINTHYGIY